MKNLLLVGAGGFLGSAFRYILSICLPLHTRTNFPFTTLIINCLGCAVLGFILNLELYKTSNFPIKEFFTIGLLGGFTTFSAFGLEIYEMIKLNNYILSFLYIAFSILFSLLGVVFGSFLSKQII